jgi:ATP-binding cassette subfamily B protein
MKMLKPYSIPIISVIIVVFLQSMGDLYLPTLMSDIVNKGVINSDIDYIMAMGLQMIAVVLGS